MLGVHYSFFTGNINNGHFETFPSLIWTHGHCVGEIKDAVCIGSEQAADICLCITVC